MNILFLCDEYPPGPHGGIGTAVQLLARELVRQGAKVVVAGFYDWGYDGADKELDEGVAVYRYRRRLSGVWAQQRHKLAVRAAYRVFRKTGVFQWAIRQSIKGYGAFLAQLIKDHRIDVIEVSDFQDYVQHLRRCLPLPQLPLPYTVKLHGTITNCNAAMGVATGSAIFETEKKLLERAAGIISVSRYALQETGQLFGIKKPAVIIPNGIDLGSLPPLPAQRNIQEVIFSGTLVALKGIYQLMKAWNLVIAAAPEARLSVYGKGALNKILPLLTPSAAGSVSFKGHVSRQQLLSALVQAPIAVFPSYAETFGLGALEAMACGCAVVFTTRAAGPEVIRHREDGLLVDPDDVGQLAQSILTLLQAPEQCARLGSNARKRVFETFGIGQIASRHLDYYKQIKDIGSYGRHL